MLKISYNFTAVDNIHTGADKSLGIYKALYREKVLLPKSVAVPTYFPSTEAGQNLKRRALALLFFMLYERIPTKRTSIWEEVADALLKIAAYQTKEEAVNVFAVQFEIRSIVGREILGWSIPKLLTLFDNRDFLGTLRDEYHHIAALVYEFKEEKKEKGAKKEKVPQSDLFSEAFNEITGDVNKIGELIAELDTFEVEKQKYTKEYNYDFIPVIKGNSIRGVLRDLAMEDYLKLIGLYNDKEIGAMFYNKLFGGGTLSSGKDVAKHELGKDGVEDISLKEQYLNNIPMFGLLGGAISNNQMIQGELRRVGYAVPLVKELCTGPASHHELVARAFNVRKDDTKSTTLVLADGNSPTAQMKFEYEVFVRGTVFSHDFVLDSKNDVRTSAFWRLMKLFIERPFICAKSAIGLGTVDLSELAANVPDDGDALYLAYVEEKKEEMQRFVKFKSQA